MKSRAQIENGDKVKDAVSGFTGIVIGKTDFLNGCTRVGVQPAVDKEGKLPDDKWFDEPQLRVIKRGVVKPGVQEVEKGKARTGGPMISTPTRNMSK